MDPDRLYLGKAGQVAYSSDPFATAREAATELLATARAMFDAEGVAARLDPVVCAPRSVVP
jgi:hypothetical protein